MTVEMASGPNLSLSKTGVSSGIQLPMTMVAYRVSKLLSRLFGCHMMYVYVYSNVVGRLFDMSGKKSMHKKNYRTGETAQRDLSLIPEPDQAVHRDL